MNGIKAILCDFHGVVVNRFTETSVQEFCDAFGVEKYEFSKVSAILSTGLDSGAKEEIDYFSELAKELSLNATPEEIRDFFSEQDRNNIIRNDEIISWLKRMKGEGITVCLATNVSPELALRLNKMGYYDIFDRKYYSYLVGYLKTNAGFWSYALKDLGVRAREVLFIDDSAFNIEAAKREGLKAILYTTWEEFNETLRNEFK